MTRMTGACHCGNLTYALEWPEGEEMALRRCTCTFCTKNGNAYAAHPRAALAARVEDRALLSRYTFGTRTAEAFVCARCGVVPWIASTVEGKTYAVVNANTLDAPPSAPGIPLRSYDGERVEERVARRRRSWIGTVEISFGGG